MKIKINIRLMNNLDTKSKKPNFKQNSSFKNQKYIRTTFPK